MPLSEDTALVIALAGTAMAFSHCAEDQAERWLRALRLHGQVGCVLQALGIGESPLEATPNPHEESVSTPALGQQALNDLMRAAGRRAGARGVGTIGTTDLLLALFDVYGEKMDRALEVRGSSRTEVFERLGQLGSSIERPPGL